MENKSYQKTTYLIQGVKSQITVQNIIFYLLMLIGMVGLGLMNWADLTFDINQLTWAYAINYGLQMFSYGSIIASNSVNQLEKNKKLSEEMREYADFIGRIIIGYRPEKLSEYVFNENLETRKNIFLTKYKSLLAKLEKKNNNFEQQNTWLKFKKEYENVEDINAVQFPNEYCRKKYEYLEKIKNYDKYYLEERIEFDELTPDDLVIGLDKQKHGHIPRQTEANDLGWGVVKNLITMAIGGALLTITILNFNDDNALNGLIKTLITVFFVILSVFKGMFNGHRVFENTTMRKLRFQRHHLHAYAMMEASKYKYIVDNQSE